MPNFLRCFLALCGLFATLSIHADEAAAPAVAESLLPNADFEASADGATPDAWKLADGITWETEEGGNHFLRLTVVEPGKMLMTYQRVDVKADHKAYALTYRIRPVNLERGEKVWFDGRIMMNFKTADGKNVGKCPQPNTKGDTKGEWKEGTVDFLVPEGASYLEIMPSLFNAKSGSLDVDDLRLVPVDPDEVQARLDAERKKREEEIARRAALVKPQVPVATAEQMPPMLKVVGKEIQTADGTPIILKGVAVASLEWSASGDHVLRSTQVAIDDWNVNCIRLGIREHFWAGTGPWQADGGAYYRQLVDDVVNLCAANGVYVILDLHCFRAPEQIHADFWTEIATRYKDHPAVLFELFNEPHDISWKVWRDGGFVTSDRKSRIEVIVENNQELRGFHSIGMQGLVDAVRDTGAKNLVMAGGLDWAYDLSGILDGYALDDRGGNGVAYVSHIYVWKSNWQKCFLDVAEKYPVVVTECGATPEPLSFIPPERHEDPYVWVPDFLGMLQKYQLHWTAWCFHPRSSPCLLSDWDYTPTPYWGAMAKDALAGKAFEMQRMR